MPDNLSPEESQLIQKVRSVTLKRKWLWCCLVILLLFPAVVLADVAYEGKNYPESAEYIDLGDLVVRDFDGLIGFLKQMPNLRRVDMWQTKMDREHCDLLASRFPEIQWGWTLVIKSADHEHLIRTDYTSWSTLHNNSSLQHSSEDFEILKYCWNLLALDIGHNNVTSLDFLYSLPNLRVLIAACNHVTDITPVGSLKDLEYAELFKNDIRDLSPLTGLTHLLDLNICFNHIQDYMPLKSLTSLKRLWMYSSQKYNVKPDYAIVKDLASTLPDTQIDYVHYSTAGTWRYTYGERRHPHYDAIVRMFGEDSRHPHYEYIAFDDSFPLGITDSIYQGTPATPIPDSAEIPDGTSVPESSSETTSAQTADPVPVLTLQQPQDFSDRNYLLPVDFSTGTAPKPEGFITPLSYEDSTISAQVTISNTGSCAYWYCDVKIKDASQLRTMSASRSGTFDSENAELRAESLFSRSSAVVMINGEFWGSSEKRGLGYIVRQGILFRDNLDEAGRWNSRLMDVLLIDEDGDFHILHKPAKGSINGMINGKRILQSFSFGPALVENGKACTVFNGEDRWIDMAADLGRQRMCICQTGPLSYRLVCCAGPIRGNTGLTLREFADLVASMGVETAYNLDGGDSTSLFFNKGRINEYGSTSQRKLRDIIYFASAEH